jgi:thiol:disulfide interchange protein
VLAFVSKQSRVPFGTSVLFVVASGMGAVMIALGTFGGLLASPPRSGEWIMKVKKVLDT